MKENFKCYFSLITSLKRNSRYTSAKVNIKMIALIKHTKVTNKNVFVPRRNVAV